MKKISITILFLTSFLVFILHDAIPHHHHEEYNIEHYSQYHSDEDQSDNENDTEHNHPVLPHQHISSSIFEAFRPHSNPDVKTFSFLSLAFCSLLSETNEKEPPGITISVVFSTSLNSYPFIISPNAMRGSPVLG